MVALTGGTTMGAWGADNPANPFDLLEQCGLACPSVGVLEGNASISGVNSIDAFFSSVIAVRDAGGRVQDGIRAELITMANLLEIEGAAGLSVDQLAAEITAALEAEFAANVQGSVSLTVSEPRCEASLEASVSAAAEGDVVADTGTIEASCNGYCEVSAEVAAQCEAEGTLKC